MIKRIALAAILAGTAATAQEIEVTPLEPLDLDAIIEEVIEQDKAEVPTISVDQAMLRGIDKLDGTVDDLSMTTGLPLRFGTMEITLSDCRYPEDNPSGEAFAFLTIMDGEDMVFNGWMIASSPALNALDHQRFDVWVLRCKTSETDGG